MIRARTLSINIDAFIVRYTWNKNCVNWKIKLLYRRFRKRMHSWQVDEAACPGAPALMRRL